MSEETKIELNENNHLDNFFVLILYKKLQCNTKNAYTRRKNYSMDFVLFKITR